jgi:hypothetical protein
LEEIHKTLDGQPATGATRVVDPWTGAVTVTVPEVPALRQPPPLPGSKRKPPAAPGPAPDRTFVTAPDTELEPDVYRSLPEKCGKVYDEEYRRTHPALPPTPEKKEQILAPGPFPSRPVDGPSLVDAPSPTDTSSSTVV